jgi:two-component system, cell cycle sensor histidine kinase and response regulator CckA
MTILVVDGEPDSRTLLTEILTAEGYEVRAADEGNQALASIAEKRPDLVLLDIRMPGMDGFEVCRQLKKNAETRGIPVIFLGASGEPSECIEVFKPGGVDFVTKPFRREELLARVRTHLEFGRVRTHLEAQVAERTAELQETKERFRTMANTAPIMIWASGPDKLCTFFNKSWLAFTGRTMEEELGDGWSSLVHPDDLDRCLSIYTSSFDARQSFQMEYRLRRADGEYRWILDKGVPLFAPESVFRGYIGSCLDTTDFKNAQEEALRRQKLESIGVLAAGIAHDFNNLLSSIVADTDLALSEMDAGSLPIAEVQEIRRVAFRASEIVRELMVYSGRETAADFEPVQIALLIKDMVELLKISVSKHVTFITDFEQDLPSVKGLAPRIRQVVMNLIINASEAIGENHGTITVSAARVTGGKDLVAERAMELTPGDYVRMEVSDTGCGMTEEQTRKIFDPFFTTKFAGRGLGLAVVQGIVRAHGGAVNVRSAAGRGTTFQIFFPCWAEQRQPEDGARAIVPEPINRSMGTVLVVEDEELLRHAMAKVLGKEHFSVIEAADGSAGIDLLRAHGNEIDLVLLDSTIPGATAREVAAEAQRIRPGINFLFISAHSKEVARQSINLPESVPFLRKPFPLRDLARTLQEVFSSSASGRARSQGTW